MPNITRYDPFGDLFDDVLRGFVVGPVGFEAATPARRMKVDVAEQNGDYKVIAELPGVRKEDIKVNIDGDQVSQPYVAMTAATIDFEKPDSSITFPNTAPSRKTGKYDFTNSTIFSIKTGIDSFHCTWIAFWEHARIHSAHPMQFSGVIWAF
jgi:hypothetical protein